MAKTLQLAARKREVTKQSARDHRAESLVPGVVYGPEQDPKTLAVGTSDLLRMYRKAGKSTLIDLDIDGDKAKVLIHDVQFHPVKSDIVHVDFFAVNLKKPTTVEIPFNFIGESGAVKHHGGMLVKDHEYIAIRCLPTDIPHDIEIDIAKLENLSDHITVADLGLDPEKYEVMQLDPETTICSAIAAIMEEEPEESEESAEGDEGEASAEGGEEKAEGEDSK